MNEIESKEMIKTIGDCSATQSELVNEYKNKIERVCLMFGITFT